MISVKVSWITFSVSEMVDTVEIGHKFYKYFNGLSAICEVANKLTSFHIKSPLEKAFNLNSNFTISLDPIKFLIEGLQIVIFVNYFPEMSDQSKVFPNKSKLPFNNWIHSKSQIHWHFMEKNNIRWHRWCLFECVKKVICLKIAHCQTTTINTIWIY